MTRAAGATARMAYHKSHPHAADVLRVLMEEARIEAPELAQLTGVDKNHIEDLLAKRVAVSSSISQKLAVGLGIGKFRLYKIHTMWVESGSP